MTEQAAKNKSSLLPKIEKKKIETLQQFTEIIKMESVL
jgi:hypothetical protein